VGEGGTAQTSIDGAARPFFAGLAVLATHPRLLGRTSGRAAGYFGHDVEWLLGFTGFTHEALFPLKFQAPPSLKPVHGMTESGYHSSLCLPPCHKKPLCALSARSAARQQQRASLPKSAEASQLHSGLESSEPLHKVPRFGCSAPLYSLRGSGSVSGH